MGTYWKLLSLLRTYSMGSMTEKCSLKYFLLLKAEERGPPSRRAEVIGLAQQMSFTISDTMASSISQLCLFKQDCKMSFMMGAEAEWEIKCNSSTSSSMHWLGRWKELSNFNIKWAKLLSINFGSTLTSSSLISSISDCSPSWLTPSLHWSACEGFRYLFITSSLNSSNEWGVCLRFLWEAKVP